MTFGETVPSSWGPYLVAGLAMYVLLCQLLRFRRVKNMQSHYGFTDRASLSRMTNDEAHAISKKISQLEFPTIYELGVRVALFKTYAVKNIAELLVSVSDLAQPVKSPKRYEDTEIIYACFMEFPPTSRVLHKAVARMNYLHAPYIQAGKILQEDLLYVLYASVVEPINFTNKNDWRKLSEMEVAALGTMWKYIGDMMDIDYQTLLQKNRWRDGIEFLEDVTIWAEKYEDKYLLSLQEVRHLGKVLIEMTLGSYPKFVRPLTYKLILVILGERLRRAFGFPEPGVAVTALTYNLLLLRKLVIRYLCLPRIFPLQYVSEPDKKTERIKHQHYLKEPWYNEATIWNRWNPLALITWASGGMIPGDGGAEMKPEGFLFEDLGPLQYMGKGIEEAKVLEDRVKKTGTGACPFAFTSA